MTARACAATRSVAPAQRSGAGRRVRRADPRLWAYEGALRRRGLWPVAGADEAGHGACAGPLVVAAVSLPAGRRGRIPGLADSKLLTPTARERVFEEVVARADARAVVVVPAAEIDHRGLHVCNVVGMRRALAGLAAHPAFVLTDGFPVPGVGTSALAVWKGDRVAACVAAASVLAKVTRDRLMVELHGRFPEYDFATHKGYVTPDHAAALRRHGPCPEHRRCFVTVRANSVEFRFPGLGDNEGRPLDDRWSPAAAADRTAE